MDQQILTDRVGVWEWMGMAHMARNELVFQAVEIRWSLLVEISFRPTNFSGWFGPGRAPKDLKMGREWRPAAVLLTNVEVCAGDGDLKQTFCILLCFCFFLFSIFFHSFTLIRNVGPLGFRLLDALPLWAWKTLIHRPGRSAPCHFLFSELQRQWWRESDAGRLVYGAGSDAVAAANDAVDPALLMQLSMTKPIGFIGKLCMEVQRENWICIAAASLLLLP